MACPMCSGRIGPQPAVAVAGLLGLQGTGLLGTGLLGTDWTTGTPT